MTTPLKIGQVIKIITTIPKAFHATHLTVPLTGSNKPTDIRIYFSDGKADLENKKFDDLAYIQFKSDPEKSKFNFKPIYNCLDKAYNYCLIEADRPGAMDAEVVLHYEAL